MAVRSSPSLPILCPYLYSAVTDFLPEKQYILQVDIFRPALIRIIYRYHNGAFPPPSRQKCRPGICTLSLGEAGYYPLMEKLHMAAKRGFHGVELHWDDVQASRIEQKYHDPLFICTIRLLNLQVFQGNPSVKSARASGLNAANFNSR